MTSQEAQKYWYPVVHVLYGKIDIFTAAETIYSKYHRLDEELGIKEYSKYINRPSAADYPMSDELKNLLTLLIGPHGKTILKMYRIKKGLEK